MFERLVGFYRNHEPLSARHVAPDLAAVPLTAQAGSSSRTKPSNRRGASRTVVACMISCLTLHAVDQGTPKYRPGSTAWRSVLVEVNRYTAIAHVRTPSLVLSSSVLLNNIVCWRHPSALLMHALAMPKHRVRIRALKKQKSNGGLAFLFLRASPVQLHGGHLVHFFRARTRANVGGQIRKRFHQHRLIEDTASKIKSAALTKFGPKEAERLFGELLASG